ncbi:MAG TPA: protein translocase subunit SecF [Candidatus Paceibacterota bacterium]|nr:protein translocase subunit SecF [Candidatus Paceibacterota bacterium]
MKYKKFFVLLSVALVAASITLLCIFGLRLGIDFKGGAQMELSYTGERPEMAVLKSAAANAGFGDALVQPAGEHDYIIKTRDLSEAERTALIAAATINGTFPAEQKSFTSIGPSVGSELKRKAIGAIILVLIAIITFIAYAFRKVSKPVSSWKYGLIAVVTLVHDVVIPMGIYVVLSWVYGTEIDTLFVVALLTILGLSVADTIVVFDRVRENLHAKKGQPFETLVGESLRQTFVRSINTSLTVILAVIALAVFGPESTRSFAIVLAAGMFFGAYSSIFLASPLLVYVNQWQGKK